ncbi:putative transposase [Francisella tularensis]|nr:putative transposase [Francisella tularensis]
MLFYIDEMGCDNKLSILRGWSLIGEPSYGEVFSISNTKEEVLLLDIIMQIKRL